jgi:hypothetical protein
LAEHDKVRERRRLRRHPLYKKPELLATAPNQVWSWDIAYLRGPHKWEHYPLYTVLDIYSRYVVGWMIAEVESSDLVRQLIAATAQKHHIQPDQLTLHADNGAPMCGKPLSQWLVDLGITKSHNRPHTSDDNPFSEAHFKTMKYRSDYPDRFGALAQAQAWVRHFFTWYNEQLYHAGLNLLTPASVHFDEANTIQQQRKLSCSTPMPPIQPALSAANHLSKALPPQLGLTRHSPVRIFPKLFQEVVSNLLDTYRTPDSSLPTTSPLHLSLLHATTQILLVLLFSSTVLLSGNGYAMPRSYTPKHAASQRWREEEDAYF